MATCGEIKVPDKNVAKSMCGKINLRKINVNWSRKCYK